MGLFSILGRLALDTSAFEAGIKRADSATTGFANKLSGDIKSKLAGAFSVGAVAAWAKSTADWAGNVVDLADAYDLTTEQIQKMQEAASRGGADVNALIQSTVKIGEARARALKGDPEALSAFSRLGVTLADLNDRNQTNYDLQVKVGTASDQSARSFDDQQAMVELLGSKSVRLTGALRELASLGPINIVPDAQVRALDELGNKAEAVYQSIVRANAEASANVFGKGQDVFEAYFQAANQFGVGFRNAEGKGFKQRMKLAFDYAETAIRDVMNPQKSKTGQSPTLPNGPLFGSDNPLFSMLGRDSGEMFGPSAPIKEKKDAAARSRFDRPDTGNLARIGGLYFGADYNARLYDLTQKIERHVARSADANVTTADALKE